jgi:23S rRNA pseudouridine2605 synthase
MSAPHESEGGERNEQRLQKIVAAAGIASRRKAEELITSGRVQVNGQKVTELGSKADPERDHIRVDGKLLKKPEKFRYFMLNKPKGVVTTVSDPEGRPTVMKFFARSATRVFPVGRLDYQSEGLLLMTNDGELANVLTSAASKVEKTYLVKVSGRPTEAELEQLRRGVMIERGRRGEREGRVMTQPASITLVRDTDNPWYEVILTEGKNREIRKMFEEVGHFVEKVRRVGFGPLILDVKPGEMRELDEAEVTQLKRAARKRAASPEQPQKPARRPRSGPATLPRPARKRARRS